MIGDGIATTTEQRVNELRRESVRLAITCLRNGDPVTALHVLLAGVEEQARVSGVRL